MNEITDEDDFYHLSKLKFALTKQNQHINTYPYITKTLKKYGFE